MKLSELLIEPEVTLELAPLIDVLFLIVLFYAVSSSLISPEDLARLKGQLGAVVSENRTLVEQVDGHKARVLALEGDVRVEAARVAERDAALAERESRLTAQNARLGQAQSDLGARDQALAAQAQRLVIADQALDDLRVRLAESRTAAEQQAAQTAQARAEVVARAAESQHLAGEVQALTAAMQAEAASHQADVATVQEQLDRLRLETAQLTAENARFRERQQADLDKTAGMVEAEKRLGENLQSLIADKSLGVERVKDRLVLELSDRVLFDSGSDQLRSEGGAVLSNVAKVLATRVKDLRILVGGHTDNVALGPGNRFGSNWALSAARAVNVVRYFESAGGVDATRLAAVGYGEFQPIASNTTPEGRARNRRIEIVLMAK